jgi:ribosome-associated toxin RatA of RatAB toxin-antitoxin module
VVDRESQEITVQAAPDMIWSVVTDFESYPEWASEVKDVEVRETDDQGRGKVVRFHVDARVMDVEYVLSYEYPEDGRHLTWSLVESDKLRQLDGEYVLDPHDDGRTTVRYSLTLDLAVPVPGFLRNRAAKQILETSLGSLKRRAEGGA